ncbi:hypothetical protein GW915_13610 [bacterium]|nr:hypothetical protein [bacterium]
MKKLFEYRFKLRGFLKVVYCFIVSPRTTMRYFLKARRLLGSVKISLFSNVLVGPFTRLVRFRKRALVLIEKVIAEEGLTLTSSQFYQKVLLSRVDSVLLELELFESDSSSREPGFPVEYKNIEALQLLIKEKQAPILLGLCHIGATGLVYARVGKALGNVVLITNRSIASPWATFIKKSAAEGLDMMSVVKLVKEVRSGKPGLIFFDSGKDQSYLELSHLGFPTYAPMSLAFLARKTRASFVPMLCYKKEGVLVYVFDKPHQLPNELMTQEKSSELLLHMGRLVDDFSRQAVSQYPELRFQLLRPI